MHSERFRLETISAFDQDVKALKRKHYDMGALRRPLKLLQTGDFEALAREYRDHALIGVWDGFREFHVQGDWLVIYFRVAGSVF